MQTTTKSVTQIKSGDVIVISGRWKETIVTVNRKKKNMVYLITRPHGSPTPTGGNNVRQRMPNETMEVVTT